jgi:hypothetical protein
MHDLYRDFDLSTSDTPKFYIGPSSEWRLLGYDNDIGLDHYFKPSRHFFTIKPSANQEKVRVCASFEGKMEKFKTESLDGQTIITSSEEEANELLEKGYELLGQKRRTFNRRKIDAEVGPISWIESHNLYALATAKASKSLKINWAQLVES